MPQSIKREDNAALMRSAANEDMRGAANEATLKTKEGSSVSSAAAGISPQSCISREPLFDNGYNDRVLNRKGQLERWIDYLRDNPRRLWLKIHHPDRLKKVYNFKAGVHRHSYTAGEIHFLSHTPRVCKCVATAI